MVSDKTTEVAAETSVESPEDLQAKRDELDSLRKDLTKLVEEGEVLKAQGDAEATELNL